MSLGPINYVQKRAAADDLLRVLVVPYPERIAGRRIVVYDDICTTGLQLDRVAWLLTSQGAAAVEGLVMARTPWRRRT